MLHAHVAQQKSIRYGDTLDGVENDIFLEGKLEKLNEIIEKELTNG